MDKLEKAIIPALEKTKQPIPIEKCPVPLGQEESYQYYNLLAEAEYPAQVYAAGSWNANGSWNPGKQWDASWRDHPNFRWSDADLYKPAPQTYQQGHPADSYTPPHQRGFPGGERASHRKGQRHKEDTTKALDQAGISTPKGKASGSGQPFQRPQQKYVDNCAGDLLNNDVVDKLQNTQNEQKAALDMLARQLSQIATSISEMRGNEGRIPATVKMPGKENISTIALQMNEEQTRPKQPLEEEESSGGGGELIQKIEEVGSHKPIEEVASEESRKVEETEEDPNEVEENISMVVIQLADCSCIRPEGIVENIIVKVHDFIYAADFYVIRTGTNSAGSSRILLGRPFLKTTTVIDVFEGTLCLEYNGEKYTLRLDEAQKPADMENLHSVENIAPQTYEYRMEDLLQEEYREVGGGMEKEVAKWNQEVHTQGLTDQEIDEAIMDFCLGSQATWSSRVIHFQEEEDFKSGK
ncbi:hypothetical protein AAHA92_06393 [Salvia divinorum]|uniref:Uncharacterized protein n=1 Tax=Salvia divinorum TaxID=28513 RepID=A0ABD1I8L5_SALDI